jgi:hypothetical protein
MECGSHFDVMRVDELIDVELYGQANELLVRIVALLTKLIDPSRCDPVRKRGHDQGRAHVQV